MDFLNLLIPKEKIVGIEIGAQKLRMLYLEKDSLGKIKVLGKSEAELEEGVIVSGAVKDKIKLSLAVAKLKKDFKPKGFLSNFAIVSISQNGVYSDIFEFPSGLADEQLVEAISLNAAANLPLPLSESYLDWQVIGDENNKKKVLVSIIPKKIADDYVRILKENGFELIALEPYFLSVARSCDIPEEPVIFLSLTVEGMTSVIYSKRIPYFSQFELWEEVSRGKEIKSADDFAAVANQKVKNLANYFESRYSPAKIKKVLVMAGGASAGGVIKAMGSSEIKPEEVKPKIDLAGKNEWMLVAGAAMRAFIPRSEDTIISLLPVGTESLYETQKAVSFARSILFLISSLAAFYMMVFFAAFTFVSFVESGIDGQLKLRSNMAMPAEYAKMYSEAEEFNKYIASFNSIYPKVSADYAAVLEAVGKFNTPGISMSNINFSDPKGPIMISGVAQTRISLNAFKSQVSNSDLFSDVKFSIQNIAQKESIPFSVILSLK